MTDATGISLAPLAVEHVGPEYLGWLADPVVVRYTEARFADHSADAVRAYVASVNASASDRIWRILFAGRHVGNVKLSAIDRRHRRAAVAILIGDRAAWGKGVAPRAIELAARHGFETLGLHKLVAGIYDGNTGSLRAFEKAGFQIEATLKQNRVLEGRYVDEYLLARFAS